MAGETINVESAWVTVIGSSSPANGAMDTGARTALSGTALSANEQKYPRIDLELQVTGRGTATDENSSVDVFRIANGNTTAQPTPSVSYKPHYCGSFVINAATGAASFYLYGVSNYSPGDTFITQNSSGQTMTYSVLARTTSWNSAA